uniref:DNA-directed RNA polymerase subunit alpha n=1 Tax=Microthamnion kuetzingianum TaxID=34148 RepID=A0A097KNG3_9CHLO|nr:alpha subunit of RNA polymerase [Microthamnion kuetzingianum]AIT94716.1 alpha subunit of RNA polymerase [Microthamnion kuetzingianum]
MQQPSLSCIQSRVENDNSLYGRFLIGPFVVGQGITIGNALRRSLLAELQGLAITAIEIEGVNHEYSTIRGVRESVLDILLNIKQIILTSRLPIEETQIAYLQIQGPGVILAKDIKLPLSIQCINPEQPIASLSFDGILKIKFFISKGKNQKPSSSFDIFGNFVFQNKYTEIQKKLKQEKIVQESFGNKKIKRPLIKQFGKERLPKPGNLKENLKPLNYSTRNNLLPYNQITENGAFATEAKGAGQKDKNKRFLLNVNAVFAPVKKVNFLLETDDELKESRDRIILEVWTNGSILPREAVHYAAKALIELLQPLLFQCLFSPFKNIFHETSNKLEEDFKKSSKNIYSLDIANLELSLRSYTCLKRAGIETVGDLLKLPPNELLSLKNFGQRSLDELKRTLNGIDISLLQPEKT